MSKDGERGDITVTLNYIDIAQEIKNVKFFLRQSIMAHNYRSKPLEDFNFFLLKLEAKLEKAAKEAIPKTMCDLST